MKYALLLSIFLGEKKRNLALFMAILVPNFLAALLEGSSFAFILLAFSQFADMEKPSSALTIPFIQAWVQYFHFATTLKAFVVWILMAILCQALRSILVFFSSYFTSVLSLRIQSDAQTKVYQQILRLTFPYVNRYRLGDLAEYAKTPSTFVPLLMDVVNRLITAAMMSIVAIYLMALISFSLTLITLLIFSVFAISQKTIIKKIVGNSKRLSEHMTDFGKLTIQTLEGLRLIHTYHRFEKILRDVSTVLDDISLTSKKLYFWNHSIPSLNEVIGVISIGSVLITSLFVFDANHVYGIPYLFTFLILSYRASVRIQAAIGCLGTLGLYVGPILRLVEILSDEGKEYLSKEGKPFTKIVHNIEFRSVTFQYGKNLPLAVADLSFTIPQGSVTAIVGPSGGGKTSILDMIIRLYEPTNGKIMIDGIPLSEFQTETWRNALGVVSQDSFIFNDTVEENIRFGVDRASYKDVLEVARLSGSHDFIMKLSENYQTKLGEKGYKLSGGELQRLSLARALLKNPQILILDEATSSLDSITERAVQNALEQYSHGRTVLIISHRLSTIISADQILYIENGRLVETGTHRDLIAKKGKYARLWSLQSQTNDHKTPLTLFNS